MTSEPLTSINQMRVVPLSCLHIMILLKISLDKKNLLLETMCLLTLYQVLLVSLHTSTPSPGFLVIPLSLRQYPQQ